MPVYIPDQELEGVIRAMRAAFAAGNSGSPTDACYTRLCEPVAEAFIRWHIGEANRGTEDAVVIEAAIRTLGWIIAQCSKDAPNPLTYATRLARAALAPACSLLLDAGTIIGPVGTPGGQA
ncbi:MAG: hypothetical protein J0H94_11920 [Rhizobiales bacterium]|nr:hypothetical protein [Hyphomicrobiales bacterium]